MAVGKRMRSRDKHLMLIIPMSSVTLRGGGFSQFVEDVDSLFVEEGIFSGTYRWSIEVCGGEMFEYRGFGKIYEQMDVTWMDKPFHHLLPRVKAIQIALKCFFVGVMAEEQAPDSTSNVEDDEMAWVAVAGNVYHCCQAPKIQECSEKRQAAGLGSSSTTAPPPTPGGDNIENARGNAVIVDLEDAWRNFEHQARPPKVAIVDEIDASATGRVPSTVPRFVLPPVKGSPELVKKSSVALSDAKAIMDELGPEALKNELNDVMVAAFKLMEISSFLNGRECKYLAERDAAKEEVALVTQRLEQAKVNNAAYREKFKLQAGLVTKLGEKEAEVARLTTEKEELEGQIKDLTTEKET
ncbi:hypothetical protein TSUD_401680 [Trifolium subterraneum]|uniref:Uncharacterized protein n=1 Tax=Trifolium subterraneum TaxID=3900 RepID=A0A2Z6PLM7_TRISU|nr:hypothetical protein TSUD_401680 [Trifolium subterraneum]